MTRRSSREDHPGSTVRDDASRHIKRSLLTDALGEEGCFGHVEVKSSVLVEMCWRSAKT
jgi:hypothetical protein